MKLPARIDWLGFARRLAPQATEADAELLGRFVAARDEAAFATLVHRHGPMVYAVCCRRLGKFPDADDAFQAAFLVLARDAAKIANRESLPGWLYRVAYLIALKASGRKAARSMGSLPMEDVPMNDPPDANAILHEQHAIIDDELASLPEKYRTVLVLCLIEGKTNAEAAAALKIPVGTVDSRLNTARKQLQTKLVRRGLGVTTAASLERLFEASLSATTPMIPTLIANTVRDILLTLSDSAAGALSPTVTSLAHGVSIMSLTKLKLLAIFGIGLGLLGTTGTGIYFATAADKPAAKVAAEPTKSVAGKPPAADKALAIVATGRTATTMLALDKDAGILNPIKEMTVAELLRELSEKTGSTIRLDVGYFHKCDIEKPYERKISLAVVKGLSVRDVLQEIASLFQFGTQSESGISNSKVGIRVKGNQIILGPGAITIASPGEAVTTNQSPVVFVPQDEIARILTGPIVGIAADNLPFAEFVNQLREQTGANIVVDARLKEKMQQPVTLMLNDTHLMTALKIAGDAYDLAPAVVGNVYYLTTKENAEKLLKETYRDIYGVVLVPIPSGTVTDGIRLYEKPANLKASDIALPRFGMPAGDGSIKKSRKRRETGGEEIAS